MRTLFLALAVTLAFAASAGQGATARGRSRVRNGPLTLFVGGTSSIDSSTAVASIVAVGGGKAATTRLCPDDAWCGEAVSFAWAPRGRRVAFTLDEIGGNSTFVGFHVLNVASGRDVRVPGGAPQTATITDGAAWGAYLEKMQQRVGCFPAAELAWSPDGSKLAYRCGPMPNSSGSAAVSHINVLRLRGSGYTTVPTKTAAFWPSWSPSGTRIAYSTQLKPTANSGIYTVALDGSQRRLIASGGAAPAWSPDGRTIAYQTMCGIRLVTPLGRNVTSPATVNTCGAIGVPGPPVWSPDGTELAAETRFGVYVLDKGGAALHLVSDRATTTWYGGLPGRPSWRPMR